jgi:hypothetical protein
LKISATDEKSGNYKKKYTTYLAAYEGGVLQQKLRTKSVVEFAEDKE